MEAKDLRDWIAFAVGVLVPAIVGVGLLGSDLKLAAPGLQIAFAVAVSLVVVVAGIALFYWRRLQKLKARLGLVDIYHRDDARPLHTVYRSIRNSYRWHGLSAVNELVGQTEVQSAILTQSVGGAEFLFVLADPRDLVRMEEQRRWEDDNARPTAKLVEQIEGSSKVIAELRGKGARIWQMTSTKLPSFRIVEIEEGRIEVTNYGRGSCGYNGVFLVLQKPASGDGMLYEWFRRAADLERKNAVLDELYAEITKYMIAGVDKSAIVNRLCSAPGYGEICRRYDEQFGHPLSNDDIIKSIDYLSLRFS